MKKRPKLTEVFLLEATCPKCGDKNAYVPFNSNKLDCPTCKAGGNRSYSHEFEELMKEYGEDDGDALGLETQKMFGNSYGELLKKLKGSSDRRDVAWSVEIKNLMAYQAETDDDPITFQTLSDAWDVVP